MVSPTLGVSLSIRAEAVRGYVVVVRSRLPLPIYQVVPDCKQPPRRGA